MGLRGRLQEISSSGILLNLLAQFRYMAWHQQHLLLLVFDEH
jgi:hypothetical protein